MPQMASRGTPRWVSRRWRLVLVKQLRVILCRIGSCGRVHQLVVRAAGAERLVGIRMQDKEDRQPSGPVGLDQPVRVGFQVQVAAPFPAAGRLEGILEVDDQERG
jgi:hypothetical protein